MQAPLSLYVGRMSFFRRVEQTNVDAFPIQVDSSAPRRKALLINGVFVNTKKSALVVASCAALVLPVFRAGRQTQVAPSVVQWIAVSVINLFGRPFAGHVEPSKSVGRISAVLKSDGVISSQHRRASFIAGHANAALHAVGENARFGFVVKKFAQTLRGKIGLSHDALQLLIGQRPGSVASTGRASLF